MTEFEKLRAENERLTQRVTWLQQDVAAMAQEIKRVREALGALCHEVEDEWLNETTEAWFNTEHLARICAAGRAALAEPARDIDKAFLSTDYNATKKMRT